jgi:hypothetical protein
MAVSISRVQSVRSCGRILYISHRNNEKDIKEASIKNVRKQRSQNP